MISTAEKLDRITVRWLKLNGACEDQVDLFRATFPRGTKISRSAALVAARAGLDLDWLANRLLDAPALKAYQEARAPAWKAYQEAMAPAWKAYQEATATKAYQEARAPALADALGLP